MIVISGVAKVACSILPLLPRGARTRAGGSASTDRGRGITGRGEIVAAVGFVEVEERSKRVLAKRACASDAHGGIASHAAHGQLATGRLVVVVVVLIKHP